MTLAFRYLRSLIFIVQMYVADAGSGHCLCAFCDPVQRRRTAGLQDLLRLGSLDCALDGRHPHGMARADPNR